MLVSIKVETGRSGHARLDSWWMWRRGKGVWLLIWGVKWGPGLFLAFEAFGGSSTVIGDPLRRETVATSSDRTIVNPQRYETHYPCAPSTYEPHLRSNNAGRP